MELKDSVVIVKKPEKPNYNYEKMNRALSAALGTYSASVEIKNITNIANQYGNRFGYTEDQKRKEEFNMLEHAVIEILAETEGSILPTDKKIIAREYIAKYESIGEKLGLETKTLRDLYQEAINHNK